MDVRVKAFQAATDTFAYLARLNLAELKQKLGDERLVDGMQHGRAQKFEYTTELCWKAIKFFHLGVSNLTQRITYPYATKTILAAQ